MTVWQIAGQLKSPLLFSQFLYMSLDSSFLPSNHQPICEHRMAFWGGIGIGLEQFLFSSLHSQKCSSPGQAKALGGS